MALLKRRNREQHRKLGPFTGRTNQTHPPAMTLDDVFDDSEAKPRAAIVARTPSIHAIKPFRKAGVVCLDRKSVV